MEIRDIELSTIKVSELNTRKDLNAGTEDAGLEDLANSIKEKGLLTPIIVKKNNDDSYGLIAGQRRFLACKRLGWGTIPAIIRDITDDTDATIISLIENVHRADMNPIDKARAYQKIYEKYLDYNKVVKETGVSISTLKKYLTLLNLAPSIQEKLTTAEGAAGIGTLSKLSETFAPDEQEKVLDKIGGFKQQIQLEMIKRSGGNVDTLEELREQAIEGAFDIHLYPLCRSLEGCQFIPEELIEHVKEAIRKFEEEGDSSSFRETVDTLKNDDIGIRYPIPGDEASNKGLNIIDSNNNITEISIEQSRFGTSHKSIETYNNRTDFSDIAKKIAYDESFQKAKNDNQRKHAVSLIVGDEISKDPMAVFQILHDAKYIFDVEIKPKKDNELKERVQKLKSEGYNNLAISSKLGIPWAKVAKYYNIKAKS